MSGDAAQDYFADGIAEEIIARLSRFTALRVLARNSTFQYKGRSVDVRQIGREIGAKYVVEGSVRKAGSKVRVTAQLLDAANGAHIWAETYERDLTPDNLFAVQDEITDQVVTRIGDVHGAVIRAQVQQLRTKSSATLADYECLLLTYEYQRFLTPDKHVHVRECLIRTVERNPDYAEAWANLAYVYTDQYWGDYPGPPRPLDRAYEAARRAVLLDPTSQIGHYALANVYFFRNDLDGFFVEAEKALAINPNNTEILAALGVRFTYAERRERGLALIHKAIALNPAHPGWYWFPVSYDHYRKGDYQAAMEAARRIDMPGFWYMHLWLAATYGAMGDMTSGRVALDNLDAINPAFKTEPLKYLELWMKSDEAVQQYADGLRKAGLEMPSK
jgi:TolB-like protein